jgi:hypothetical protein
MNKLTLALQIVVTILLLLFWTLSADVILDTCGLSRLIYCMERLSGLDRSMITFDDDETIYVFKLKG